ncbi:hypothetical protein DPMN_170971 [Dreissena polymorpha]|uniref:Uncharacterized protein n=1 Tax=Dreissena polymorpha TaxID=45954 RepID=A0A9D4E0U9_DREPO|nr:hypothetical protein DPMN_170971 [Dreissena polymorpha]
MRKLVVLHIGQAKFKPSHRTCAVCSWVALSSIKSTHGVVVSLEYPPQNAYPDKRTRMRRLGWGFACRILHMTHFRMTRVFKLVAAGWNINHDTSRFSGLQGRFSDRLTAYVTHVWIVN